MHVDDISLSAKQKGPLWDVSSQITIVDEFDSRVGGAAVMIAWSGDLNLEEVATTDGAGVAGFSTGRVLQLDDSVVITVVVTGIDQNWNYVHLLCSDGLTKHVSDERIAERLRSMASAKQVCEDLLQDALDDGGSDNITIIVGRAVNDP